MDEIDPVRERAHNEREYLRFQVRAGELLASSLDVRETILNVCAAAVETVADLCYLIMKNDAGALDIIASCARDSAQVPETATARKFLRSDAGYPPNLVEEVVRRGHTVFVPEVDDAYISAIATSSEHADFLRRMRYASLIIIPIPGRGEDVLGALSLVCTRDSGRHFDEESVLFARGLARSCGGALVRAQDFASSLDVAMQFQRAALPRSLPSVPGIEFDAYYESAEASLLIGGDWYDAFLLPSGAIGMSMGDVTGHGVEAAALMGNIRNALRTAVCAGLSLDAALDVVDFLVRGDLPDGSFATANIATLDPDDGTLRLISAGHPGPLLYLPDDSVRDPFIDRGAPLGLRDLTTGPQPIAEIRLQTGSFLLFFTDGVIEWQRDELKGYDQLIAAMLDPATRLADRPARAVRRSVITGPHADDVALMSVRYER